jgi:enediyne biosynthesis protein E4
MPVLLPLLLMLAAGCRSDRPAGGAAALPAQASAPASVRLTDITAEAGITFKHTSGRTGRLYFPETVGAGGAFLDYNNDGRLDLFFVNSSRLPGFKEKGPFYPALYRNEGNGRFTDVTKTAGLALDYYGMGVAVADYDGDGFQDLFLTALGPNHLFRNNGNGTFAEVTAKAGVGKAGFWTSAVWWDYDRDGHLDLFVGNYCRWSPETNKICPDFSGEKHMCSPTYYKGLPSALYRNQGDGTFVDVTKAAGLHETVGKALGMAVFDSNGDGWQDLAIARDKEPNSLYRSNGNGTFTDVAVEVGVAYSMNGTTRSGMGIDTADVANDGREAILIGNLDGEGHALYSPDATGHFTDTADTTGLLGPSLPVSTFAALFVDYDGDGWKDCFTANGHVDEKIHLNGDVTFEESLLAFRNVGGGKFQEVGAQLGPIFAQKRVWRGLACGDIDNDGDPDLLATACNGKPALLRNDGGNARPWLQVKAIAAGKNRQGLGTKVTVTAGGVRQSGWIRSGSSYCSQNELKAFFGLGTAQQAEQVELLFPSGKREVLQNVKAGQLIVVQEGKGLVAQGAPGTADAKQQPPAGRLAGRP